MLEVLSHAGAMDRTAVEAHGQVRRSEYNTTLNQNAHGQHNTTEIHNSTDDYKNQDASALPASSFSLPSLSCSLNHNDIQERTSSFSDTIEPSISSLSRSVSLSPSRNPLVPFDPASRSLARSKVMSFTQGPSQGPGPNPGTSHHVAADGEVAPANGADGSMIEIYQVRLFV